MKGVLADQNFDGPILRGLQIRLPALDVVRTEDIGLKRFQDPDILSWTAAEGRLILTHDTRTFISFAYQHIADGKSCCGLIAVPATLPRKQAIDDLVLLIECMPDDELNNKVIRVPL